MQASTAVVVNAQKTCKYTENTAENRNMSNSMLIRRIDSRLALIGMKRADLCRLLGLNITAMTQWDKIGTIPRADVALKLSDILSCTVEWLILGEEKAHPTTEEMDLIKAYNAASPSARQAAFDVLRCSAERQKKLPANGAAAIAREVAI